GPPLPPPPARRQPGRARIGGAAADAGAARGCRRSAGEAPGDREVVGTPGDLPPVGGTVMLDDEMIGARRPEARPQLIPVDDAVPGGAPAALLVERARRRRVLELDGDDPPREFLELGHRIGPAAGDPGEVDLEADLVARRREQMVDRPARVGEEAVLEFV